MLVTKELIKLWPLWEDPEVRDKIRELAHIASNGEVKIEYEGEVEKVTFLTPWKKHRYYAVIQADGDNIGRHICKEGLSLKDISDFSEKCWRYSQEAAKKVRDFGGVPIYVGGDDLLAIVPVENDKEQNVFWLLQELREEFEGVFGKGESAPTLSFGVSIQYYKFPLYESLARARELLFGRAKNAAGKNAIALRLQKHSGQSLELVFKHGENPADYLVPCKGFEDQLLHSVMTHLRLHNKLFAAALVKGTTLHTFRNIFHEELHQVEDLPIQMYLLLKQCGSLATMDGILRLAKFFVELGEEENHG